MVPFARQLEGVEDPELQAAQRGRAAAEAVERDPHAQLLERPQAGRGFAEQDVLAKLDLEAGGIEPCGVQAVLDALRETAPGQLTARQQRHRQVELMKAHGLPGAPLRAGRTEHPVGQGFEHAAVLGQRHEPLGADRPELRMIPVQQPGDADSRIDRRRRG